MWKRGPTKHKINKVNTKSTRLTLNIFPTTFLTDVLKKNFDSAKKQEMPRAYANLNPALSYCRPHQLLSNNI